MLDGSSSWLFTSSAAGITFDSLAVAASWLVDVSPLVINSVAVSLLPDVSLRIVYLHLSWERHTRNRYAMSDKWYYNKGFGQ